MSKALSHNLSCYLGGTFGWGFSGSQKSFRQYPLFHCGFAELATHCVANLRWLPMWPAPHPGGLIRKQIITPITRSTRDGKGEEK